MNMFMKSRVTKQDNGYAVFVFPCVVPLQYDGRTN